MRKIKQYAVEILKRIVFVILPLAIALDSLLKWTNSKLFATTIMVAYVYVSLFVIRWFSNRRHKHSKS